MGPVLLCVVRLLKSLLVQTAAVAHAGHDLHQFGSVAALDGQFRDHMLVQGIGNGARVRRHYHFTRRHDVDFLLGRAYLQRNVGDTEVASLRQDDVALFPGSEPVGRDRQRIGAGID